MQRVSYEVPAGMPRGEAATPRARALYCCREMAKSFAPYPEPQQPIEISRLMPREVFELLAEFERDGRVDEHRAQDLKHALAWRNWRAMALHENASRLRGAFWAQVTLRAALVEDGSDVEVEQFAQLLPQFLLHEWHLGQGVSADALQKAGIEAGCWRDWVARGYAPDSLPQRSAIAALHAWLWQRTATYGYRQATQETLHV